MRINKKLQLNLNLRKRSLRYGHYVVSDEPESFHPPDQVVLHLLHARPHHIQVRDVAVTQICNTRQ